MSDVPATDSLMALLAEAERWLAGGQPGGAEPLLRQVLAAAPRQPQALHLLGLVALSAGHASDAEKLIGDSLAIAPDARAWVNRATALNALGRFAEAVESCRTARTLQPELLSALINQAGPLQALGRIDEAVAVLEEAVARDPERAEAHNNLGNLYKEQGRIEEALAAYQAALAVQPLMQEAFSNLLATSKLRGDLSPQENLALHRAWSAWFETGGRDYVPFTQTPDPARRLRVGYLSPDCHTAVPAFIRPVWNAHDPGAVELFAYFNRAQPANGPLAFPGTARVMAGQTDAEVARQIRADGIDVLIDLAGHTGRNRLGVIAREAAPVQITWLDYLGTTGLRAMHWRLTDTVADPPGLSETAHSEQLLRMPHTQWCWAPPAESAEVTELPLLLNGHLTFGSFNNFSKLTAATRSYWRALLEALPDAQLLVAGAPEGRARQQFLADMGPAAPRVRFAARVGEAEYRKLFGAVDVALDPTPFSGATTSLDAYWQGVPVATFGGPFPWSRSTASLSAALSLRDWIFDSADQLIDAMRVVQQQPEPLRALRRSLRERVARSAITDAQSFTRDLEANIRKAWFAWCESRTRAPLSGVAAWDAAFTALKTDNGAVTSATEARAALQPALALYPARPSCAALHAEIARAALSSGASVQRLEVPKSMKRATISFIICSIKPAKLAAITACIRQRFQDHEVEVIGLTDARSLAEAYNRGAQQARGEWLVFCHDDIDLPQTDFADRLFAALDAADLVGVAGASQLVDGHWEHAGFPHLHGQIVHRTPEGNGWLYFCAGLQSPLMTGMQALDGVFLACRRRVWERVPFDAHTFDGFHLYDIDFSLRAARAGFNVAVSSQLLLVHDSLGGYNQTWQRYNRRFLAKFPAVQGLPNRERPSSLHVRLNTWQQVEEVHAALLEQGFGRGAPAP